MFPIKGGQYEPVGFSERVIIRSWEVDLKTNGSQTTESQLFF
jgi:hypothetical protein